MTDIALRDYQREAITSIAYHLENGHKRVVLGLPTGGGKTRIAAALIEQMLPGASGKFWFIVDRLTLVDQAARVLRGFGLPVGVLQAETREHDMPVIVASSQTLELLDTSWAEDAALAIIDEAHIRRTKIIHAIKDAGTPTVGLTATPLRPGMDNDWQTIINVSSTDSLTHDGHLVPMRIFEAAPSASIRMGDERGESASGEWTPEQVKRKTKQRVIGELVKTWEEKTQEHFGGPVPTLVFTVDTEEGARVVDEFNARGHKFEQGTYRDDRDATAKLSKRFADGEFNGLVSVAKFAIGYDHPSLRYIVGARPYRTSVIPLLQSIGRGLRTMPDGSKEYCLYSDHAENISRWWSLIDSVWSEGVHEFRAIDDGLDRENVYKVAPPEPCGRCGNFFSGHRRDCPACGWVRPLSTPRPLNLPGIIREVERVRAIDNLPNPDLAYDLLGDSVGAVWMHVCQIVKMEVGVSLDLDSIGRARWYFTQLTGKPPVSTWPFFVSGVNDETIIAATSTVRRRYADERKRAVR